MEIRLLTADDAELWWHLRLEALHHDSASFADSAEEHQTTTVESVRADLVSADPAQSFVVGVFEDGKLAGTAGFYRQPHVKERHKGYVWGVYVRPESRGKGAARSMMQEILRRAREMQGLEQITLVVSAHLPARKLYEGMGFVSYGMEPRSLKIRTEKIGTGAPGTEYVDDVLMILWL
jgi:ribosomal protein S18 acetylase RimI-like enzyme